MNEEIAVAAGWWAEQLKRSLNQPVTVFSITTQNGVRVKHTTSKPLSPERVELFRRALIKELIARYEGHWYPEDVQRGSGYRSLSYDSRLDTTLRKAAKSCGIESVEKLIPHSRGYVMFVNPGEVKVANTALMSSAAKTIFTRPCAAGTPAPALPRMAGPTTIVVAGSGTAGSAGGTASKSKLSPNASPFASSAKPQHQHSNSLTQPLSPPGAAGANGSPVTSPPRSPAGSPALPATAAASAGASGTAIIASSVKVVNRSAALLPAANSAAISAPQTASPPHAPLSPPLSPPLPSTAGGVAPVERRLSLSPVPAAVAPNAPAVSVSEAGTHVIAGAGHTLTIRSLLTTLVDRVSAGVYTASGSSSPASPPSSDTTPIVSPSNASNAALPTVVVTASEVRAH